jgi:uncharacterized membrane protein HdeD (DUF308 family)
MVLAAVTSISLVGFSIIWTCMGIAALIYSLICMSPSQTPNVWKGLLGIALAILLGPFYFIYYWYSSDYCTAMKQPRRPAQL